jgi:hypothetical protein
MGLHRGRAGTSTEVNPEGGVGPTRFLLQTPVVRFWTRVFKGSLRENGGRANDSTEHR